MKIYIPLKDIILGSGKLFDPNTSSVNDVIERVRKIYGVIANVITVSVQTGIVEIEFRDSTPEKFKSAMKSLQKGIDEANQGRLPKALKLFREVLTIMPENVEARRNMAKIYLAQNKLEKAKQLLHECLQIEPKDSWSYIMLGNIYSRNENNPTIAAFYYEKCLEHHPENAVLMTNFAALMMETGEFQKAEVLFKKAIKIQDVPNAYYGLALLYRMANHLEAARQVLDAYFTRTTDMKTMDGSPVEQEAKNLYKEISTALGIQKQTH